MTSELFEAIYHIKSVSITNYEVGVRFQMGRDISTLNVILRYFGIHESLAYNHRNHSTIPDHRAT